MSRRLGSVAVLLLSGLIYVGSLGGGYVYDDVRFVERNPAVQQGVSVARYFTDPATQSGDGSWQGLYRPVRTLSFRMTRWLGEGAGPQRAVNLAIHLANGLLVWLLLRRLLGGDASLPPLLGALAFLLHPLASESVAWISSRGDLLGLLGMLGATILWLEGGRLRVAAAVAAFGLALLAKESAAALPLLLLPLDAFRGGWAQVRSRAGAYAPFLLVLAVFTALRYGALGGEGFAQGAGRGQETGELVSSLFVGGFYYVYTTLLPTGLSFELHVGSWKSLPLVSMIGLLVVVGLPVLVWILRSRGRPVALAVSWFVIALLPVTALQLLFPLNITVANRFAYPALIAAGLLVAFACARHRAFVALTVVVLAAFVPLTYARAQAWRTTESLWSDVLEKDPENPVALLGLGRERMAREDWPSAAECFRRFTAQDETYPLAHMLLGRCEEFRAAAMAENDPDRPETFRDALQAYNNAVRFWQGGANADRDRQFYRPTLLYAGWLAAIMGVRDVAWEHAVSYLRSTEDLPPEPDLWKELEVRLVRLEEYFRRNGNPRLGPALLKAAGSLRKGGVK